MKGKTGSSLVARIIAAAVAAVVVITGTPATVLADGEVTVETVASDESAAESAVSKAISSAEAANTGNTEESVTVKETVHRMTEQPRRLKSRLR